MLLESAGRPDAIAGGDPAGAAGLTQIVAETALELPRDARRDRGEPPVDEPDRARARGRQAHDEALRLEAARTAIDARFDPAQALAGTVRYLSTARARFGRDDLAVASYHMGIGNLESVLRDYAQAPAGEPIGAVVHADGLSYARVFFDSSPVDHPAAWRRLAAFGDDSKTYYWRAARRRADHAPLPPATRPGWKRSPTSTNARQAPKRCSTRYRSPNASSHPTPSNARDGRACCSRSPTEPSLTHFRARPAASASSRPRLGQKPALYRALRPEALALLCLPRRQGPHDQRQRAHR